MVVVWHAVSLGQAKPRQDWGVIVLVIEFVAVGLALMVLLPNETRRLLRNKDLLIPLGLYVAAQGLLAVMLEVQALAALLAPTWSMKVLSISITLSLGFVIQLVLGVIYAGWTTVLVLQVVREERVDAVGAFAGFGQWFLRVLATEFIAWVVLFICLAIAIALGSASIELALILIAACSVVWNLSTAALLLFMVSERRSFGVSFREGIRVSWNRKSRWWVPVVVQLVLLGWVTFIYIEYTSSPRPGTTVTHTKTNWRVNGFWTGGYESDCRWHTDLMRTVEAEPLPIINTLLGLLFAVFATVIKLRIAEVIGGPAIVPQNEPSEKFRNDTAPDAATR
jgi:hypothetical protein